MMANWNFTAKSNPPIIHCLVSFIIMSFSAIADQSFEIQENAAEGTQIGQLITAPTHTLSILRNTDPDGDGNDAFRLEGSNLLVNDSGDLDYEGIVE